MNPLIEALSLYLSNSEVFFERDPEFGRLEQVYGLDGDVPVQAMYSYDSNSYYVSIGKIPESLPEPLDLRDAVNMISEYNKYLEEG